MIAIALLALVLPGYALVRALRVPFACATAFPLSALLLTETVIALAISKTAIRFATVLTVVGAVSALSALFVIARRPKTNRAASESAIRHAEDPAPRLLVALILMQCALVLACFGLRATLYPLSGFDAVWRWEALSRLMIEEQSLSAYPPVNAEDFQRYIHPDGISPLVATMYWWLYAAWGAPMAPLTSVIICLQAGSCLALVFHASRIAFGTNGALLSVCALASSSLFFFGTVIGQETGFTALSYAGQLAFALHALREPGARPVIVAGLFAGLGALAREYGPVLGLCGGIVLLSNRATRRYLPLFILVAAACAAPWYARIWLKTGNPIFPYAPAGLNWTVNTAHALLLNAYSEHGGFRNVTAREFAHLVGAILAGAPVAIVLGVLAAVSTNRNAVLLALLAVIPVGLWAWSVQYTQGGIDYSLRVLTPAVVALSVAAGGCAPLLARLSTARDARARTTCLAAWVLLVAAAGYGVLYGATFPFGVWQLRTAVFSRGEYPDAQLGHLADLAKVLNSTGLPAESVLTDNCYLAMALQRYSRFRPVMIWSPEVSFVLDKSLPPEEVRRRLREERIWYVSIAPSFEYLWAEYPLFGVDGRNWRLVNGTDALQAVYFLPPVATP
jgi:hypothetical protein